MPLLIETERLILREWRDEDLVPLHAMNNDPIVCEFFPDFKDMQQARAFIHHSRDRDRRHGYSFQPVIEKATGAFVGDIGLAKVEFDAPFTGQTEIGWMMQRAFWGKGYATEMAAALLNHAFTALKLQEVLAFTVPANLRSRRVMDRLGMRHDEAGRFDHPSLLEGHPLRSHVLYRKQAPS